MSATQGKQGKPQARVVSLWKCSFAQPATATAPAAAAAALTTAATTTTTPAAVAAAAAATTRTAERKFSEKTSCGRGGERHGKWPWTVEKTR